MTDEKITDARILRALARAGMDKLWVEYERTGELKLSPQDIVNLTEKGTKMERLAMGEATERIEAIMPVDILPGICEIFKEVNTIKGPDRRMRLFYSKIDEFKKHFRI